MENHPLCQGNSYHSTTGLFYELTALQMIRTFPEIERAVKDYHCSKNDVYFRFHGESSIRGCQIKGLFQKTGYPNQYTIEHTDKYEIGTLIIAFDNEFTMGLAYIVESKHIVRCATVTTITNPASEFSRMVKKWHDFIPHLRQILRSAPVISYENFINSMSPSHRMEYESMMRFEMHANKFGIKFQRMENASSPTDAFVNDRKAQFKYRDNITDAEKGPNYYYFKIAKHKGKSYVKGENYYYILEGGGEYKGCFFIITEDELIEKGYIQIDDKERKISLNLFPYDYVEKKLVTMQVNRCQVKGNWTCDRKYWHTYQDGWLGAKK
jgi:hypothetical protein